VSAARRTLPRSTVVAIDVASLPPRAADAVASARGYTTSSVPKRDNAEAMSSTNPRAKTSWAGSPERFSKGTSAMLAAMAGIRV